MGYFILAAITALIALLLTLNLTGLFHRESAAYRLPEASRLMDAAAAPIEIRNGKRKAVIFIHGFPSSPSPYREPCAWASEAGYDAFAPLLPGHGTKPADLIDTNFSQYAAFVRDYYLERRPSYEAFHLVGISMGGIQALKLAEDFSGTELAPTTVSTIGTPAAFFSPFEGVWTYPASLLARSLGWLIPSLGAGLPDFERQDGDGGERWRGYTGLFPRQSYSYLLGMRSVRRRLGLVRCPYYGFHSRDDRIIGFPNLGLILASVGSDPARAWVTEMEGMDHSRHDLLLYDSTRERVWNELSSFFRTAER